MSLMYLTDQTAFSVILVYDLDIVVLGKELVSDFVKLIGYNFLEYPSH